MRTIVAELARQLGVPARELTPGVRYVGSFYGRDGSGVRRLEWVSVDHLLRLLRSLEPGVTELGCHPGLDGDGGDSYGVERAGEVESLCDPRVRALIAELGVELQSFPDGVNLR